MATEVEFPENIANVTKSVSGETLQIETLGKRIFLMARDMLDSHIYVVTEDNVSYCLHLIVDDLAAVPHVGVKKPLGVQNDEEKNKDASNTIELMKNLITGKASGSASASGSRHEEIFNDKKFRIVMDEDYEFPGRIKAFVVTFENLTARPLVIPIEHIEIPGLLAISVEKQMLEARTPEADKKPLSYTAKAYMIIESPK
jgi:hypothetical protein